MYNYVVTAHKPTSVTNSITGNFTSPNEINLIISKTTRLEIHTLTPDGLEPFLDVGIYGRIASIFVFRPKAEKTDLLFLLTEKNTFSILGFDPVNRQIITKSSGDLRDKLYRPIPVITSIDPDNRVIGLLLYSGYLKVIPIDPVKGTLEKPYNIRLEETNITGLKFLSNCETPTFAILYRDPKINKNLIKTYKIEKDSVSLLEGPWRRKNNLDLYTHLIIPVPSPYNGVLIVSDSSIQYFNHDTNTNINIKLEKDVSTLLSYGKIDSDGSRYLLGDNRGGLFILLLERDESLVIGLKLKKLGVTSIPASITYLDNGVVYIGSYCGDSQLIKLSEQKKENDSFIELLDTFINLGPIVDFCLVDIEKQGQTQIVSCSGCYNDGSLRIIRNGVGVNQQAVLELPGVKGIWSIRSKDLTYDDFLVVSFLGQTRFFSIVGEEIEDVSVSGVSFQSKTLHCSNVSNGNILQITEKSIKLLDKSNFDLLSEWKPENESDLIHLADVNQFQQILISSGKSDLAYFEIIDNQICLTNKIEMEHEVSCLNIRSLYENEKAKICAIGLWSDNSVRLLSLPKLEEVRREVISSHELPRSILLITLESISYLLCGLGDGQLIIYTLDIENEHSISYNQKLSIGSQPVQFNVIKSQNINNSNTKSIFVSSDKPTLFYSYNKRLICSSINLSDMNYVTTLHTSSFQNCLAIYSTDSVIIGTIDEIQKLHLTSIPLNAMPRRIVYQESTHTYAVITLSNDPNINGGTDTYSVRLLDADTFETLFIYNLRESEMASQIINFKLGGKQPKKNPLSDSNNIIISNSNNNLISSSNSNNPLSNSSLININDEYFIVGVALSPTDGAEVKEGRILVLQVQDSKLVLIAETRIHGAPFSLSQLNDKFLVGINTLVRLFQLNFSSDSSDPSGDIMSDSNTSDQVVTIKEVSNKKSFIIALKLASRGNSFLVGDAMRSLSLLYYNDLENKLEEIARDFSPKWTTSVEFIDEDNFLLGDHHYNIYTLQRQISDDCDESRTRLETVGKFHIGDQVNILRAGSIVRKTAESEAIPTILFGTMMGSIGVIAAIPKEDFDLFEKVQTQINLVIKGVGGLTHEDWRAPYDDKRTYQRSMGYIDGDLIESFLELNREKKEEVVKKLNISADELSKKIESLSHLLH